MVGSHQQSAQLWSLLDPGYPMITSQYWQEKTPFSQEETSSRHRSCAVTDYSVRGKRRDRQTASVRNAQTTGASRQKLMTCSDTHTYIYLCVCVCLCVCVYM